MDGLRKSHSKTRLGCSRCKKRRVRCDLRPPVCRNCERRGERCDYSAAQAVGHPIARRLYVSPHSSHQELPDPITSVSFELAIHFDALTSNTFDLPETPLIWRKELIKRTEQQSCLRNSSLALAALHITYLRPMQSDIRYLYNKAHAYQNEAYAVFRNQLKDLNDESGPIVLEFCVMAAIFQLSASLIGFGISDDKQCMDIMSPLLALRSGALLLGSSRSVTVQHKSLGGALGRLGKEIGNPAPLDPVEDQKAFDALDKARFCLAATGRSTQASMHALHVLRQAYKMFGTVPKGWLHVIFWPAMTQEQYHHELREEQPAATVVFVYWCAYLNNSLRQWYLEKWPKTAALHKMDRLDSSWHDILDWPRDRLGLSDRDSSGIEET